MRMCLRCLKNCIFYLIKFWTKFIFKKIIKGQNFVILIFLKVLLLFCFLINVFLKCNSYFNRQSKSPLSHSLFLPVPWKVNTQQGSEKPNVWVVGKCGKNYPLSIENNFSGKKNTKKNKMPEGNWLLWRNPDLIFHKIWKRL